MKYKILFTLCIISFFCANCRTGKETFVNKEYKTSFDYRTGVSVLVFSDSEFTFKTDVPFIMTSQGKWSYVIKDRKKINLVTDTMFLKNFYNKKSKTIDSGVIDLTGQQVKLLGRNIISFRGLNYYYNK